MNPTSKKSPVKSNQSMNKYVIWLGLVIVGIVIGLATKSINQEKTINTPVENSFSYETVKIAKDFNCSCGSCGEKGLVECTCPIAMKTKQFIEKSISDGLSPEDVADIVKMTYGHQKG